MFTELTYSILRLSSTHRAAVLYIDGSDGCSVASGRVQRWQRRTLLPASSKTRPSISYGLLGDVDKGAFVNT
jgi:hypothetical protein